MKSHTAQSRPLKTTTSFRLSADAKSLLAALAHHTGLSQAGVLEVLIRDEAEKVGLR